MIEQKLHHPELWEDEDIDRLVQKIYDECDECLHCMRRDELGECCEREVIFELWRKWKNAKERENERLQKRSE